MVAWALKATRRDGAELSRVHQSPETEATTTHSDNTPSLALAEGCEQSVRVEAGHLSARCGLLFQVQPTGCPTPYTL